MYSVNAILGKTVGYETEVGVLENMDYITKFNAIQLFEKALNSLKSIVMDIATANDIKIYLVLIMTKCFTTMYY